MARGKMARVKMNISARKINNGKKTQNVEWYYIIAQVNTNILAR